MRVRLKQNSVKPLLPTFFSLMVTLTEWVQHLRDDKLWGNDDPLFPATRVVIGKTGEFEVNGLDKKHWRNSTPYEKSSARPSKEPTYPITPHSFRHTVVCLGKTQQRSLRRRAKILVTREC